MGERKGDRIAMKVDRNVLAALVGVIALLVSAGTALAAPGKGDRAARCEARLAKVAEHRGVSVAQLEAQVKARMLARVDAALRAGRISAERAATLRSRISSAELCGPARIAKAKLAKLPARVMFRAAARYLDVGPAALRDQLRGTSLAALAAQQGKSVEGLKAAMLAPAEAMLARAVESGRITQARADRALARFEHRVDRMVQRTFPAR